jgi:hypothetical protein
VISLTLNDLELEDPVKSSIQFLEALNQEDPAFRVFPLQTAVSLLPRAVCSPFLLSLPPAHLLINPLAEVRIPDLLCSLRTRSSPRVRVISPRVSTHLIAHLSNRDIKTDGRWALLLQAIQE